nr:uncharacterized protein LOC123567084 [Macaca fascicularis]
MGAQGEGGSGADWRGARRAGRQQDESRLGSDNCQAAPYLDECWESAQMGWVLPRPTLHERTMQMRVLQASLSPARCRAKPPPSASRLKPAASPRFPAPAAPELGSRRRTWPRILRWEVTTAGHRGFLAARPRVQGHKRRWKEAHAPRRSLALALPGREALRASALGATRSRATRQGQPGARDPELGCEQDAAPRGRLARVGVPKPRPYLCFMLQCPSALASQWPVRAALSHRPGDRGGV